MQQVRWGVLGTGRIARLFALGLESVPDARLVAVGSRTAHRAESFLAELGRSDVVAHGSYEALAQDANVDIVYVATPHVHHREHALLCLAGGRAVLVEKPFSLNVGEAREVIQAARASRLFCMEAMWMRFSPMMRRLRELLDSGEIGAIRMIDASLGFFNEYDPTDRLFDIDLGGGSTLDLGVYPISFIMALLGPPTRVSATATSYPSGVDEQMAMTLDFPGGEIGVATCSLRTGQRNSAFIYGEAGTVEVGPLYMPSWITVTRSAPRSIPAADGTRVNAVLARLRARARQIDIIARAYRRLDKIIAGSTVRIEVEGNGYNYEAAEATRCLAAGEIESPIMSHVGTLDVMKVLDEVRSQIGLRYPTET